MVLAERKGSGTEGGGTGQEVGLKRTVKGL
jgi:hypothetical protein